MPARTRWGFLPPTPRRFLCWQDQRGEELPLPPTRPFSWINPRLGSWLLVLRSSNLHFSTFQNSKPGAAHSSTSWTPTGEANRPGGLGLVGETNASLQGTAATPAARCPHGGLWSSTAKFLHRQREIRDLGLFLCLNIVRTNVQKQVSKGSWVISLVKSLTLDFGS